MNLSIIKRKVQIIITLVLIIGIGVQQPSFAQNGLKQKILQGIERETQPGGSIYSQQKKNDEFKRQVKTQKKAYNAASRELIENFEMTPNERIKIALTEFEAAEKEYNDLIEKRKRYDKAFSNINSFFEDNDIRRRGQNDSWDEVVHLSSAAPIVKNPDQFIKKVDGLYKANFQNQPMSAEAQTTLKKHVQDLLDNSVNKNELEQAKEKRNKKAASFNAALDLCPECAQSKNLKKAKIL